MSPTIDPVMFAIDSGANDDAFKILYERLRNCIAAQHKCDGNYGFGKCKEVGRYCFEIESCEHWSHTPG